jgi:uncharacterized membrane protein YqgA involved in biofilm formation
MVNFEIIKAIIEIICGAVIGYLCRMLQEIQKIKKEVKKVERKPRAKKIEKPKEQTTLQEIPAEPPKTE